MWWRRSLGLSRFVSCSTWCLSAMVCLIYEVKKQNVNDTAQPRLSPYRRDGPIADNMFHNLEYLHVGFDICTMVFTIEIPNSQQHTNLQFLLSFDRTQEESIRSVYPSFLPKLHLVPATYLNHLIVPPRTTSPGSQWVVFLCLSRLALATPAWVSRPSGWCAHDSSWAAAGCWWHLGEAPPGRGHLPQSESL